jgi:hypothetical protein
MGRGHDNGRDACKLSGAMRHLSFRLATSLPLVALAGACSLIASRGGPPRTAEAPVRSDSVIVRVENRDEKDLSLLLSREGGELPLGAVPAKSEVRFAVRAADVRGGRLSLVTTAPRERMHTASFRVQGGQVIWFEIVPGLAGSRLYVRWWDEGPPRRER